MTAFDKKVNQIAARHRWNIEKQARAAVPCYIIAAPTYEDAGKIVAVLNRCKGLHHETLTPIHYESWAARFFPVLIGAAAVLPGADRGGQLAEEKPGRTAQAVHSGFFVSAD